MADTTNLFFNRPTVGGSEDTWGTDLNENWAKLDAVLWGDSYTDSDANTVERIRPDLESGLWSIGGALVTATASEINKLSGVTYTLSGLNGVTWTLTALNGLTATVTEINYLSGVTSAVQTQLNAKQPLDAALTSISGVVWTANKIPYTTGVDTFSALNFRDQDDMSSDDALGIPSQQSVKAYVDAGDASQLGVGQTWQDVSASRSGSSTSYQNTTGKPIMVSVRLSSSGAHTVEVSSDGSTWVSLGASDNDAGLPYQFIVPNNHYYRITGSTFLNWVELR